MDEYGEEEDIEGDNAVEIFFQPKQLNDIRTISNIEIFLSILNEKMYDQLRTKEDLCYRVGCELKKLAGTVGITFYI